MVAIAKQAQANIAAAGFEAAPFAQPKMEAIARIEAAYQMLRQQIITPQARCHQIAHHHLDWIRFDCRYIWFPEERVARVEFEQKWSGYAALFDYTETFAHAPETKPGVGWLLPFLKPFTGIFAKAFGLAIIVSGLQMLLPVFTQVIVDRALVENDASLLTTMIVSMLVVLVLMTVAMLVQRYLLSFAAMRIDSSTLDFLTRKLLALPMSYFAARKTGDIQRRLLGIRQVREFFVQNGVNGLSAIKGIETVKALGAEGALREKMLGEFHGLAPRQFKSSFIMMSYDGAIQTVGFLSLALFLFAGAHQVMNGSLTIGAPYVFTGYADAARYVGLGAEETMFLLAHVAPEYDIEAVRQALSARLPQADVMRKPMS